MRISLLHNGVWKKMMRICFTVLNINVGEPVRMMARGFCPFVPDGHRV